MPVVYLTTSGTRASLTSERLHVEYLAGGDGNGDGGGTAGNGTGWCERDIPLCEIEHVVVAESAALSMPAQAELMRREIPVMIVSRGDRVLGVCHPPSLHGGVRLEHYKRSLDPAFKVALAINWVEAKILNCRRVLQRLAANRPENEITPVALKLGALAEECRRANSLDTLRGYEGTAAGQYFEAYGTFFPADIPFERRSRRPPHNPPNAVLSYAYTLLAAEAEHALYAAGLDPALGFYHEPEDRRASLALDIIEPFRAPFADAMALDLFSHGTLNPKSHFEPRNGGIYLGPEGRKRFFVAYERRMERTFTSEQHGQRTSLRKELIAQAVAVKQAIVNGEAFVPFMMN